MVRQKGAEPTKAEQDAMIWYCGHCHIVGRGKHFRYQKGHRCPNCQSEDVFWDELLVCNECEKVMPNAEEVYHEIGDDCIYCVDKRRYVHVVAGDPDSLAEYNAVQAKHRYIKKKPRTINWPKQIKKKPKVVGKKRKAA